MSARPARSLAAFALGLWLGLLPIPPAIAQSPQQELSEAVVLRMLEVFDRDARALRAKALAVGAPRVVVDPGGASASSTTERTETDEHPDGRRLETVNRAVLHFAWRGGRAVVVAIEQDDLTPPVPPPPAPP